MQSTNTRMVVLSLPYIVLLPHSLLFKIYSMQKNTAYNIVDPMSSTTDALLYP